MLILFVFVGLFSSSESYCLCLFCLFLLDSLAPLKVIVCVYFVCFS